MVKIVEAYSGMYQLNGLDNVMAHIEKCGRTCYKSGDKITDSSAKAFIAGILKSGHESVIEHANLIFTLPQSEKNTAGIFLIKAVKGLNITQKDNLYILSGNMRTFRDIYRQFSITDFNTFIKNQPEIAIFAVENAPDNAIFTGLTFQATQESDLGDMHCYLTAHFYGDVGVYKDITRHRLASFSIESTRYCNYAKDKFGAELNMMKPVHIKENTPEYAIWLQCMQDIENHYIAMSQLPGIRADQLRMMLPHSTKADVIMTANIAHWRHVFSLRCAASAHPAVQQAMKALLSTFHHHRPHDFQDLYAQFIKNN